MKDEFDSIKRYIIKGGINRYIILHTFLRNVEPTNIDYLPFHYIRIKYIEGSLSAIVTLFGTFKFMVFFEEFKDINEFKPIELLDNYHVYDINNKSIFRTKGDSELRELDNILLRSAVVWGKYKKNNPKENS